MNDDQIAIPVDGFQADSFHFHQFVGVQERPVLLSIVHDGLCLAQADPLQVLGYFLGRRGIDAAGSQSVAVDGEIVNNNTVGTIRGFGIVHGDHLQNKGTIEASMGQLVLVFGSVTNTGSMKVDPGTNMFVTNLGFSTSDTL